VHFQALFKALLRLYQGSIKALLTSNSRAAGALRMLYANMQGAAKLEFARCCMRTCRKELAAACVRAGLAPLSERELGFVESARNRHLYSALLSPHHLAANAANPASLEPGFLELV